MVNVRQPTRCVSSSEGHACNHESKCPKDWSAVPCASGQGGLSLFMSCPNATIIYIWNVRQQQQSQTGDIVPGVCRT